MKKTVLSAIGALACAAAFAAVESGTTLCRIEILSSRKDTLLSIPLQTVGATGDAANKIDITKYVLTQGLKAGDKLMKRTNGQWETWTLDADDGNWVAGKTISGDNLTVADATLDVGDVIQLTRATPSGSFFLYGELPVSFAKTQTAAASVWTMLGNPEPVATTLSSIPAAAGDAGFQNGDRIYIPVASSVTGTLGMNAYYYDGTAAKWKYDDYSNATTQIKTLPNGKTVTVTNPSSVVYGQDASSISIPAGEGMWYVRASGAAAPLTVNWGVAQ